VTFFFLCYKLCCLSIYSRFIRVDTVRVDYILITNFDALIIIYS